MSVGGHFKGYYILIAGLNHTHPFQVTVTRRIFERQLISVAWKLNIKFIVG